ncbi:MAG: hypothetical protein AAB868_01710 [Patescibacteria group bacterium]
MDERRINENKITLQELFPQEKSLYIKVSNSFASLDNAELGEYSYDKLPERDEVMKLLKERELLEVFEKFKKRIFTFLPKEEEGKKAEFEKLARVILKESETIKNPQK